VAEDVTISVVLSVRNGVTDLPRTIDSVLSQGGVDFEVIAVDDGSTDRSGELLAGYAARDHRLKVVRQEQTGLTRALRQGCDVARGEYIARQDVGDVSLPGRLKKQRECLEARPGVVFVSCGTRFVGPRGEHLYDVFHDEGEIMKALRSRNSRELRGPAHHGSVMFRRAAYEKVGGYRREFYFAQDLDLWVRLAATGDYAVVPELFYEALVGPGSLSGTYRRKQLALTKLIAESADRRRAGAPDEDVLSRAAAIRPTRPSGADRLGRARAFYFIASCLRQRRNAAATRYFLRAVRANPLHLKAWCRLLGAR
jgi:glycosyltransferase involved in cell wall biosynthesis